MNMSFNKLVCHYWVGVYEGCIMSTSPKCPLLKPTGKMNYMGFTSDISWPKTMNTGRILHKSNDNSKRKRRKKWKQKNSRNVRKTDTIS